MKDRFITLKRVHNSVWFRVYEQSRTENLTIPELCLKSLQEYLHRKKEEKTGKAHYLNKDGLYELAQRLRIKETGDIQIINRMIEVITPFQFPNFDYQIEDEDYLEK